MKKPLEAIVESTIVGVYLVQDGIFRYVNPALSRIFGYKPEELMDKLGPLDLTHPDDREMVRRSIEERIEGRVLHVHSIFKGVRKDGSTIYCEAYGGLTEYKGRPAIAGTLVDITEQKRAQDALKASEERYRTLVETARDVIFRLSLKGEIVSLNLAFEALTGWSRSRWIGKHFSELVHPEDFPTAEDVFRRVLERESLPPFDVRLLLRSGGYGIYELTGAPVVQGGKVVGVLGIARDVTVRKEMEEKLKWDLKVNALLSDLSRDLLNPLFSLRDVSERLLQRVMDLTSSQHGFVSLIEPGAEREVRLLFAGVENKECAKRTKGEVAFSKGPDGRYHGLWGHALNTGQPFFTNEPGTHEASMGVPKWHPPLQNFMAAPGVVGDEVVGQIALANSPNGFTQRYLEVLERVAGLYALAVRRHYDTIALQESEERYRLLVESSLTGVFIHQDGRYVFVNKRFARMHGYEPEELIGRDFLELIHPEDREAARQRTAQRIGGKLLPEYHEIRRLTKDGRVIWCEMMAVAIKYKGRPAVMGNVVDVTKRRQAEEGLRDALRGLHRVLEQTIQAFASTVEKRDPYTAGHQKRVARLALAIAKEMRLSREECRGIYMAGLIHDIGKISVPAEILAKPTRLTDVEFDMLKLHSKVGYEILKRVEFPWPIAEMVLQHHERWDGSGYPMRIRGEKILLGARILAVADVVEAMASHRPYRPALGLEKALEEVQRGKGTAYDPQVVDACVRLFRKKGYRLDKALERVEG